MSDGLDARAGGGPLWRVDRSRGTARRLTWAVDGVTDAWAWVIDVVGMFLVFLSLTGLGLLSYLEKVRLKALLVMAAGAALVAALAKLAT